MRSCILPTQSAMTNGTLTFVLVFLPLALCDRVLFNCTFEVPALCNFRQDFFDDLDWDLFHPSTMPSSMMARYVDHTFGYSREEGGHYARLHAQGGETGKASIMTSKMNLTQGVAQVSFFYHMWDPEAARDQIFAGQLNVYACNKRLVWTRSGNLGDVWYRATFRFECNGEFSLTFEGILGGVTPDIAIDDVNITDCFNGTTTLAPPTMMSYMTTPGSRVTTLLPSTPLSGSTRRGPVEPTTPDPNSTSVDGYMTPEAEEPILPNEDGVISEEVAVSLVLVAFLLFASTCLLLFFTLILHCCRCCCNGNNVPAHIIYHAPSYINPDARLAPEEYMLLNFNGRRPSASSTTGTGFFTLSDRGGTTKSQDRSSFGSFATFSQTTRLLGGRRTSTTFPGVREIKNFLQDFHLKRIRSFSSHVTAAELEAVRRRLESASMQRSHRNRTRSTILLDRSGSMIRPISEISEHFYYSLFPEATPDYVLESESNQSSVVDLRMDVPARVSTIELLSHDRYYRRRTNSSNLRIIWTSEEGVAGNVPQASAEVPAASGNSAENTEATPSEMVENEIYECYSDDEVKC